MSASSNTSHDSWRAFAGTGAGKLLTRIYGNQKPQVHVPKPKTKPSTTGRRAFIPGGGTTEHDPRKSTFNREEANEVVVPAVGGARARYVAPINRMTSRRRTAQTIQETSNREAMSQEMSLGPMRKAVSTDIEKRKLQAINQYKGGLGLPEELTEVPLQGNIPLELITGKMRHHTTTGKSADPLLKDLEEMAKLQQDIMKEIDERVKYINELKELDPAKADNEIEIIRGEIDDRTKDLDRLEKMILSEKHRIANIHSATQTSQT